MLETVLLGKRDFLFFLLVYFFCFPGGSVVKNPLANVGDAGDVGLIPGLGRFPGNGGKDDRARGGKANTKGAWTPTMESSAKVPEKLKTEPP